MRIRSRPAPLLHVHRLGWTHQADAFVRVVASMGDHLYLYLRGFATNVRRRQVAGGSSYRVTLARADAATHPRTGAACRYDRAHAQA